VAQYGAFVISELTQWSGLLRGLASDLGQVVPKVRLYDTFLGGLRHSPQQMKNQHGLNEEKTSIGKKISQLSACDVTRVVSLDANNQA
jgi:hypothetical protein